MGVVSSTGPSTNLIGRTKDRAKVTAALIQELMEELRAIEQESPNDKHDSEATQESDLEQEDSKKSLTEDEGQWLAKTQDLSSLFCENYEPDHYHRDMEATFQQSESSDEYGIDHTEEVIIGSEQGITFPTKIGTTICNALIDTGATRCCISEKYYRKLQLTKIILLQNVNIRSATSSNLAQIGLINCSFELGGTKFNCDFIVCRNLSRPLLLGRDFLNQNHISVRYSENGKCISAHKQQELVASISVETTPQLSLTNSMTLPGRTLAVVHVNNDLKPEQSGQLYEIEPNYLLRISKLVYHSHGT